MIGPSGVGAVPAVLRRLTEQLGLQRENVIEDAINPPALEPVIGYQAGVAEQLTELQTECRVDAELAAFQGFLEHHQAEVEDLEAMPALQGLVHSLKT